MGSRIDGLEIGIIKEAIFQGCSEIEGIQIVAGRVEKYYRGKRPKIRYQVQGMIVIY